MIPTALSTFAYELKTTAISYSQAGSIARCEDQWFRRYELGDEREPSDAMRFGTLWHELMHEWWGGTGNDLGAVPALYDPLHGDKLNWLLARYIDVYGIAPTDVTVVASELEFYAPWDGLIVHGFIDRVVDIGGQLWIVEDKTYSKRSRIDMLGVDPQIPTYVVGAEFLLEREITGVIWNGAYTYQWKKDRDAEESFDRLYLDVSEADRDRAHSWYAAAVHLRRQLRDSLEAPLQALNPMSCMGCEYRAACWHVDTDDIELED